MNSSIESKHIKGGEFMTHSVTKVAAAHIAPVFLDKKATTAKAISWIEEAAKQGAQLVVFPESFLPGFPIWAALWAPLNNHDLFQQFVENSLFVDGPEVQAIAKQAKKSPKAAARRKSFCARMSGMPGPMKDDKGRPTRKALSLRKWDC